MALWHWHTTIQSIRWESQALHPSTQGAWIPPQLSSTNYKSPTSAHSGRAENLISNVNFLLLKNLKRIWGGSEKLIPIGPNKFKPQSLKLLFPKAKSCSSLAGREPLTFAAKQSFTRSMLKCKSAPSNWSCVSNPPFPHLHLLENSSKGFHKYLHIKCSCSDISNIFFFFF